MVESLLTALILFWATLVSSTFGFGSALLAMPLLTLVIGISTATPLFGCVGPTIAGIILVRNWQRVDLASAWRLVLATLAGIPIGVWLVRQISEDSVTQLLGVFLVGFGLYRLLKWRLVRLDSTMWATPIGFIAGILGGAYNINGPAIVIYGEMRRWSPSEFRATLQSYFLLAGLGILASHGMGGLWNERVFQLYGISLPGIVIAIALGGWINRRLSIDRFQTLVSGLLIVFGILLWL